MSTRKVNVSFDPQQLRDAARYIFEHNPAAKDMWGHNTPDDVYQEMKRQMLARATENAQALVDDNMDEWCNWSATGGWIFTFFVSDDDQGVEVEIHVDPSVGTERRYLSTTEVVEVEEEEESWVGYNVLDINEGQEYHVLEDNGAILVVVDNFDPTYSFDILREDVRLVEDPDELFLGKLVTYCGKQYAVLEDRGDILLVADSVDPRHVRVVSRSEVKVH